ncbi:MAG TPA: hypothetical protein PKI32_08615, partial [Opitutales bacterium]|nr:hypothetical protein [Opitutales bacterium]
MKSAAAFLSFRHGPAAALATLLLPALSAAIAEPGSNPLFRDTWTADPAPLVVGDTLYLYCGHDDAHG